jgi:hypothetical protein
MKLDYAQPPKKPPNPEWCNVAVATSVAAVGCLVVSVMMYELIGKAARELQLAIALTSIFLAVIALVTGVIAVLLNPRGTREIAALATVAAYAAMALLAMKYL